MRKFIVAGMLIAIGIGFVIISGCSKSKLSTPFQLYFYTTNKSLPTLYMVYNNKVLGKLPVLTKDPVSLDSTLMSVICSESTTEITGVDKSGHVIQVFDYNFNDDATYKEAGGGYLLYDTWQKQKYNLLIRVNQQF